MHYEVNPSVGFAEAGRRFFRNATNFSGRARRSEYWWALVYLFLVNLGISALMGLIGYALGSLFGEDGVAVTGILAGLAGVVWGIYVWIASLSLCIRRLHDTGRSGWWYLLGLIPFGGLILFIMFLGDSGPDNQWGPNPKTAPVQNAYAEPPQNNCPPPDRKPANQAPRNDLDRLVSPTPAAPQGILRIESGPMAGRSFRFEEGAVVALGRDPNRSNLLLSGYGLVSGVHCKLLFRGGILNIVDTGSTNGTFVNNIRQVPGQPVAVPCPATICLGDSQCTIQAWME